MDTSASMGTDDGGTTRLANVASAVNTQLGRSPDASDIGLREFSTGTDGKPSERILVPGGSLSEPNRRATITDFLNGLRAGREKTSKYPALASSYKSAVDGFDAGRVNSVLLITSSTPDESTTTRAELLSAIAAAGNPSRPVQVDVIVVGAGDDVSTLQDVSDRTGGNIGSGRFDVRPRSRGRSDQDAGPDGARRGFCSPSRPF